MPEDQKEQSCIQAKVDIGILKQQVTTLTSLSDKLQNIVDKLVENHSESITKIYERMEERRMEDVDDKREIHDRIDNALEKLQEAEVRLLSEMKGIRQDINENNTNLHKELQKSVIKNDIQHKNNDKWKWMVTGGIIVISWLLLKIDPDTIIKLLTR